MTQQSLLDGETEADRKFTEFHKENPEVYRRLVEMTAQLARRGHKRIGMQMLFEVLRWRTMLRTTDADFKINNNYASRYARLLMNEHPEYDGFFEIRGLKS